MHTRYEWRFALAAGVVVLGALFLGSSAAQPVRRPLTTVIRPIPDDSPVSED
jgi:hypothetical protein